MVAWLYLCIPGISRTAHWSVPRCSGSLCRWWTWSVLRRCDRQPTVPAARCTGTRKQACICGFTSSRAQPWPTLVAWLARDIFWQLALPRLARATLLAWCFHPSSESRCKMSKFQNLQHTLCTLYPTSRLCPTGPLAAPADTREHLTGFSVLGRSTASACAPLEEQGGGTNSSPPRLR